MHPLESLERAGWDALCAGTGGEFYGSLMMPDAVMVLAHGAVLDRDQVVASLDEAPPWTAYRLSDVRRVPLGPEASALVYRGEASRPRQDFVALMTSCYVRHEGDWRLAVHQQTVMP